MFVNQGEDREDHRMELVPSLPRVLRKIVEPRLTLLNLRPLGVG